MIQTKLKPNKKSGLENITKSINHRQKDLHPFI